MAAALTEEGFWPGRSDLQEFYPRVYLSNTFGARNLKKLQANGITHVLICGSYLQPAFPEKFNYKQMKLDDNATEAQQKALLAQLDEALDFVDTALKETDANVLLHCGQGRSRSGAVAAAIVMVCNTCYVYHSMGLRRAPKTQALQVAYLFIYIYYYSYIINNLI